MNFLQETIQAVIESGHTTEDVMFIGSRDGKYRLKYNEFAELANFDYDNGFGGQEIASDMIIYFYDKSYITRGEYDGSEWWEYNEPLDYSDKDDYKSFKNMRGMWDSIHQLNK
jgi:hypothetical protein